MWRLASIFLSLQVACVLSNPLERELVGAEQDDECFTTTGASCALNALQKRGARAASTAGKEAEESEELDESDELDELEGSEELELLETEEAEESGSGRRRSADHSASAGGDITKHEQATELRALKHRKAAILEAAKHLDKVEASVNETYVMTMKELAPGKDASPPPMPKLTASGKSNGGRRRQHHASMQPPRERKVSRQIDVCEAMVKNVWARIKRSSKIMVYAEKRITGGEIGSLAIEASDDPQSSDDEEKEEGEEEEKPAGGAASVSMKSGKADLDARIKQLSKETYDADRDIKGMDKRAEALRKLFKDTYTTS